MELKDIVAIAGKGGLFKTVSQTKKGIVVESLTDGNRQPAFVHDRISSLAEISLFTTGEDRPLRQVMQSIREKENGGPAIDAKSDNKALKAYFLEAIPDYDTERVYVSDIKKIISWYNILQKNELLGLIDEPEPEPAPEGEPSAE
jgi:hypothetical protein